MNKAFPIQRSQFDLKTLFFIPNRRCTSFISDFEIDYQNLQYGLIRRIEKYEFLRSKEELEQINQKIETNQQNDEYYQILQNENNYYQLISKKKTKNMLAVPRSKKSKKIQKLDSINKQLEQAFKLLDQNYKLKQVAQIYKINLNTLIKNYEDYKQNYQFRIQQKGRKPIIKIIHSQYIKNFIDLHPCLTSLVLLRKKLEKTFTDFKNGCSLSTIAKQIKLIDHSRKRVRPDNGDRNKLATIKKNAIVAKQMCSLINQNKLLIFIDECSFNHDMVPFYGYSKKDQKLTRQCKVKKSNNSMCLAHDQNKIYGIQIFEKGMTSQDFRTFIINLIKNTEIKDLPVDSYYFFLDNAKIHHANINKDLRDNFAFFFSTPYSPFLNPKEEVFSLIKNKFRIKKDQQQNYNILQLIVESVCEIIPQNLKKFVAHSYSFLRDSINENIIN